MSLNNLPPATYDDLASRMGAPDDIALARVLEDRWQASLTYSKSVRDTLPMLYDAFHIQNTGTVAPGANNLGAPILFGVVATAVAKQANVLVGQDPICSFIGYNPEEQATAGKNDLLVTEQLRNDDVLRKLVDFLTQAHLTGTGFARWGWKFDKRNRMFRIPDNFGGIEKKLIPVTNFDGPSWMPVDLIDVGLQPGKKRIKESEYITFQSYDDLDMMKDRDAAHMAEFGVPLYLPGSLAKVSGRQLPNLQDMFQKRMGYFPSVLSQDGTTPSFAKPVRVREMFGLVPPAFAKDGDRNRHVIVINDHTVVQNAPNPYWSGALPGLMYCPSPDPYSAYGVGKGHLIEPLQNASARLMNSRLDALDRGLQPHWTGDANKLMGQKKIIARPGGITLTRGDPRAALVPVDVNFAGYVNSFAESQELSRYAEMAGGITEAGAMGLSGGGDRQTAREFLGRQEASATRPGLEAALASTFIEELCEACRDLNQQYLTLPKEVSILGDAAQMDEETGLPVPPVQIRIEANDLAHNWKAKAQGPLMLTSKASQRQDAMQLISVFGSISPLAQSLNWAYVGKKTAGLFDGWDIKKLFVQQPTQMNMAGVEQDPAAPTPESDANGMLGGAGGSSLNEASQMDGPDNILGGGP